MVRGQVVWFALLQHFLGVVRIWILRRQVFSFFALLMDIPGDLILLLLCLGRNCCLFDSLMILGGPCRRMPRFESLVQFSLISINAEFASRRSPGPRSVHTVKSVCQVSPMLGVGRPGTLPGGFRSKPGWAAWVGGQPSTLKGGGRALWLRF